MRAWRYPWTPYVLLLAAAACGTGCGARGPAATPESAVNTLIASARAGDRLGVYQILGPRTRGRIDEMLSGARKTGGTRMLRPEDLVTVGWVPPAWEAAGTRLGRVQGNEAEVEVYSAAGDRQTIRVVREDKTWKVELPLR